MARSTHDKPGASYRASKKLLKIKQTEETNKTTTKKQNGWEKSKGHRKKVNKLLMVKAGPFEQQNK